CTSAVHSATRSTTSPAPIACRGRHEPPALGRAPRRKDDKPKLQRGMAHPVCRGGRAAPAARPVICWLLFDAPESTPVCFAVGDFPRDRWSKHAGNTSVSALPG